MPQKNPVPLGRLQSEGKGKCPECGGEIEFIDGELVCKKCGLVVE